MSRVLPPRLDLGAAGYHNLDVAHALDAAEALLLGEVPAEICFLNIDSLRLASLDPEYRAVLKRAALVLPDGIGIRLATRVYGGTLREDCNGSDLSPKLVERAARHGLSVFLLGAQAPVVQRTAKVLQARYPGVRIAGTHHGYFTDSQPVLDKINASGAQLLLVAMGVPRQEKWIAQHRAELHPRLCMGVGNLFSWISGSQPRAPVWVQRLYLEWVWRILLEPRRLFRRYVLHDIPFLVGLALRRWFGAR
jgi:N-acetylglucosaminyldiphosphoundecaprenol N-acetyl-beta-D-mannosaminyltransferase